MNRDLIQGWIKRHGPNGATKLASAACISSSTLSRILQGKGTSFDNACSLADALGVSLDDLRVRRQGPPSAA
jgi:transcriptional regulator with XRE-family HTH domain